MIQLSLNITEVNKLENMRNFAACKKRVVEALAYFDIFQYPLTSEEIRQFLSAKVDENFLQDCLCELQEEKIIFLAHGFYSIQNNPLLAHRRRQGNQLAGKLLAKAFRIGRFLYQFPFVRAVGISGSLSKNYADEKADIDFFIITKANRLWIARTLMHLYKKITFLTGREHFHCMNYYIDEKALLLEEKNIFTAIEIKTLLPACGEQTIKLFFGINTWANEYLPACNYRRQEKTDPRVSWLKKFLEWMLNGKPGDRLENYLFKLTQNRWKRKMEKGKRNKKGQTMDLITGKHFARSNPGAFQEKVLALYEQKLSGLKQTGYRDNLIVSSVK
ncbi:MAG TPA: hypothetical protein VK483_04770 [Chitinophagaceae bacterium]|nr:hypothetical protein [Chitinophagaceae bacterium]